MAMRPRPTLLLAAWAALGALAVAGAAPPEPEPRLFFGEDWEPVEGDFPAARAARDVFLGYLDVPATEDFEGERGRVLELALGGYGARLTGGARDSVSSALRLAPGRRATS